MAKKCIVLPNDNGSTMQDGARSSAVEREGFVGALTGGDRDHTAF